MNLLQRVRRAPFTLFTALLLLAIFATTWMMGGDTAVSTLFSAGVIRGDRILAGEWWRILSSEVLHSNWNHVWSNCIGLILFGLALEPRLGTSRTVRLYLLGAIGSSAITIACGRHGGGASGAIFSLVGGYLARPMRRGENGSLAISLGWLGAVWWVFRILPSGSNHYAVGYEPHVAGLLVGLWFGALCNFHEEPAPNHWTRPRRAGTAALATLGIALALAPDPRWTLMWQSAAAQRAERVGNLHAAIQHWATVEYMTDPRRPLDAVFVESNARFWLRRHEYVRARTLLDEVAPTINSAKTYRDAGFLMIQFAPYDEHAAMRNWGHSLALNACQPEVLDAMAYTMLDPADSTLFLPQLARNLALRAVALDSLRTPEFIHTLAWANYYCGDLDGAIDLLRRTIELNPKDRGVDVQQLEAWQQERADRQAAAGLEAPNR